MLSHITITPYRNEILHDLSRFMLVAKEFPLAHNVEKLSKCKEVAGIGSFLFKKGFNTTQSQLASHLAVILYGAKIWNYNGKVIWQRFWFSGNDSKSKWCKEVQDYYIDLLQND